MVRREQIEQIISAIFALGLGCFSLALIAWTFRILRENKAPFEAYLMLLGLYLVILALLSAKLLSKMLEV